MAKAGIWLPEAAATDFASTDGRTPGDARTPGEAARSAAGEGVPVLTLDEVRFGFERERPVLRSIDLAIAPGERIALVGPNGSGKTTLLRLSLGLLRPVGGRIRLGGRDPSRLRSADLVRLAGYVVQDPELGFLGQTVGEEIELGLDPDQLAFARDLCERLRLPLESFGERSPYRLSGGEQRRLSLVTGLARRPLLLALDEPTYGQDRRGHEALVAALEELVDAGSALVAATHDERFVRDAADRRVELTDGWVVADEGVDRMPLPAAPPTGTRARAARTAR